MKKILTSLIAIFFCLQLTAQEFWFEAGLKGGIGLSFLYNKNIVDDDNWQYKFTPMSALGAKFSVNFGPYHGVFMEALFNQSKQDFNYNTANSTEDFAYSVKWKSIDTYLLYRGIRNRTYFEIGPMYSLIQKVEQGNGGETFAETTSFYKNGLPGGVFGFGGYVAGAETFSVGMGVRLHYVFGDMVTEAGQNKGYPTPVADPPYSVMEKTSPLFALFLIELNFGVGRFAKTACSERFKRIRRR